MSIESMTHAIQASPPLSPPSPKILPLIFPTIRVWNKQVHRKDNKIYSITSALSSRRWRRPGRVWESGPPVQGGAHASPWVTLRHARPSHNHAWFVKRLLLWVSLVIVGLKAFRIFRLQKSSSFLAEVRLIFIFLNKEAKVGELNILPVGIYYRRSQLPRQGGLFLHWQRKLCNTVLIVVKVLQYKKGDHD